MDKENKIETAKEYCKRIDLEEGEVWSNDYEELPLKMQEYAQYYHQAKLPETLAELEKVKTTRDQYFKAAIHAQDKLTQAEKELGKLRDFVQEFYNLKNPSNRQWFQITEKAYQLLTPKE